MSEQSPYNGPEPTPSDDSGTQGFDIEALHEETRRRKAAQAEQQQKTSDAVKEFHRRFVRDEEPPVDDTEARETQAIHLETGVISIGVHSRQKPLNEDTVLRDEKLQLFGVFDGMGGYDNGHIVSPAAAFGVRSYYARRQTNPVSVEEALERAKEAMAAARDAVMHSSRVGGTTAVFSKIEKIQDKPYFVWGNAGDSRSFIQTQPDEAITPISTNQAHGRYVLNGLYARPGVPQDMEDEFGAIPLAPNNRLMLCSDGVTGDTPEQQLSDDEMQWAFQAIDPQEAAERFITVSKKRDDKSVLIIDVHQAGEQPTVGVAPSENRRAMPRAVLFPAMRTAQQEKGFKQRIGRRFRCAKEALQAAPAALGVVAVAKYHKTQEYFKDPEKGKSRRRAIVAGAAGAIALFAAYKLGLFDDIFGGTSKPPSSTGPPRDLRPPISGGGAPESVQPPTPSRPPNPPPESLASPTAWLTPGDTIWGESADFLQSHGYPATDVNVDTVKDAVLQHQGITELEATQLPVGYRFTIPLEILDKLHK